MSKQNGYAVAYGVCIAGATPYIKDSGAADYYLAQLVQSADLREEPIDVKEFRDTNGVIRTKVINGTRRRVTLTLIPTNATAGASGGIDAAEAYVKLPPVGEIMTLLGFQGASVTTGPFNRNEWIYEGRGRVIATNDDAVRLEVELEQIYDSDGTFVSLSEST